MVIALAGRRITRPQTQPERFPERNAETVRDALVALFRATGASALVGSGACGADLLAMEAAGALGMERAMVIAGDRARFRARSVADAEYARDWGALFDKIADEVAARGGLIVINPEGDGHAADLAVNEAILDTAAEFARRSDEPVLAVVVWEGRSRGEGDVTAAFRRAAAARAYDVTEVLTTTEAPL